VFYTARRSGLRGRKLVYIATTAPTRHLRGFLAFLRGACATVRKSTYTLRQTYVYVRNRTPVICNLTCGYANFIRHKYAVPMHKVRNHTPSYASLCRSCDFFMSTQPEYADNFGVEGTRDYATLRRPGVKGA